MKPHPSDPLVILQNRVERGELAHNALTQAMQTQIELNASLERRIARLERIVERLDG